MTKTGWTPLALLLLLAPGCAPAPTVENATLSVSEEVDFEAHIAEASAAYGEAQSFDEKLSVFRGFLEVHGVNETVAGFLHDVAWDATKADRADDADALINDVVAATDDPKLQLKAEAARIGLYARDDRAEELAALAARLENNHELRFFERYELMNAADETGAWELMLDQAEKSKALANAAAFKADYPKFSDADAARKGETRIAYVNAFKGWALANLGRTEEAYATFEAALPHTHFNVLGVDDTPLHRFWGRTLLLDGRAEEAMEKLAVEAIYSPKKEALEAYKEAYSACHEDGSGFHEHLLDVRRRHGKSLDDFTLANYEGEPVSTSSFQGDVLLLAFWFPT